MAAVLFDVGGEKLRELVDGLLPWEQKLPYGKEKGGELMPLANMKARQNALNSDDVEALLKCSGHGL